MTLLKTLQLNIICLLTLLSLSCKETPKDIDDLNVSNAAAMTLNNYAIKMSMEGEVFQIKQRNLEPNSKLTFKKDSIFLEFWEDGNPLKLNLNLTDTTVLKGGTKIYKIPNDNSTKIKADLNFFNKNRDVKRMNKRIIFRKGTIRIAKITEHELQMTFEGEGSGLLERGKDFPISGQVHINF